MRILSVIVSLLLSAFLLEPVTRANAESTQSALEQSMSDALDLWREGRYEQLYEHLAHRGKTSREQFVKRMRDTAIRPACCFQKLENFKVLNEKRTEATVYAKVGLEGTPNAAESCTREFKLTHEENIWKMQLADVLALSGAKAKKTRHAAKKKYNPY
jgi:maltodextrin utilization protein YvdJ